MIIAGGILVFAALTPAETRVVEWLRAGLETELRAWSSVEISYDSTIAFSPEWFAHTAPREMSYAEHRSQSLGKGTLVQDAGLFRLDHRQPNGLPAVYTFDGKLYRSWNSSGGTGTVSWTTRLEDLRSPRIFLGELAGLPSLLDVLDTAESVACGPDAVVVHAKDAAAQDVRLEFRTEHSFYPQRIEVSTGGVIHVEFRFEGRNSVPRIGDTPVYHRRTYFEKAGRNLFGTDERVAGTVTKIATPADVARDILRIPDGYTVIDDRFGERLVVGPDDEAILASQVDQLVRNRRSATAPEPQGGLTWQPWAAFLSGATVALLAGRAGHLRSGAAKALVAFAFLSAAAGGALAQEEFAPFAKLLESARKEQSCAYWTLHAWARIEGIAGRGPMLGKAGPHSLEQVRNAVRACGVAAEWVRIDDPARLGELRHAFVTYQGGESVGHFATCVVAQDTLKDSHFDILLYDFPEPARRVKAAQFAQKYGTSPILVTGSDAAPDGSRLGAGGLVAASAGLGLLLGAGGAALSRRVRR